MTWIFEDSKWGYWWRAVKDNPEAAESLGVVVFHSKMAAAAVSALFTSIAGSFYAQFVGYIDPESVMTFQFSLLMALPAVLGGIGTLWGPALGAVILIPLNELVRSYFGGSGAGIDLDHLRPAHHHDFAGAARRPRQPVHQTKSACRDRMTLPCLLERNGTCRVRVISAYLGERRRDAGA